MCTPLWAISGHQTPRPIILHPLFLISGYCPAEGTFLQIYINLKSFMGWVNSKKMDELDESFLMEDRIITY